MKIDIHAPSQAVMFAAIFMIFDEEFPIANIDSQLFTFQMQCMGLNTRYTCIYSF